MKAAIIQTSSSDNLELIVRLAGKLKIKSRVLTEKEIEDIGLAMLMREANRNKTVTKATIKRNLLK